jgi:hypothetical protein
MCGMARRMKNKNIMRSRLPLRLAVSVFSYLCRLIDWGQIQRISRENTRDTPDGCTRMIRAMVHGVAGHGRISGHSVSDASGNDGSGGYSRCAPSRLQPAV